MKIGKLAALIVFVISSYAWSQEGHIYHIGRGSPVVTIVDVISGNVASTLELPTPDPIGIFPTPGGAYVFITHLATSSISVIDGQTRKFDRTIEITSGTPSGLYFSSMGDMLYVALEGTSDLAVFSHRRSQLEYLETVSFGSAGPVVFNRRGTRIYRTDSEALLFVLRKDHSTMARIDNAAASEWTISPNYRFLVGVGSTSSSAVVIDEGRRRIIHLLPDAHSRIAPMFSQNGDGLYVVSTEGRSIAKYDTRRFRQTALIETGVVIADLVVTEKDDLWILDGEEGGVLHRLGFDGVLRSYRSGSDYGQMSGQTVAGDIAYVRIRSGEGFACF